MKATTARVMSLRLPEHLGAELQAVARAEEVPISEVIRAAIYKHIAERRADKGFQEQLRKRMEADREVLERLARSD